MQQLTRFQLTQSVVLVQSPGIAKLLVNIVFYNAQCYCCVAVLSERVIM